MMKTWLRFSAPGAFAMAALTLVVTGCGSSGGASAGAGGAGGSIAAQPVTISTATRTARTTTWSVNYWQWAPTYGNDIAGTESLVAALAPALMRVGGYNNDANTPDPFDDAQLDAAVAYARAIGAEPVVQVPLIADAAGQPATADGAAAMVRYANVTKAYALKYFSIGNEPDLYATAGARANSTMPAFPGFAPADYCAAARAYVAAMKAVDPTIQIVGPDLSYKYVAGGGSLDWLTPILQGCGELFDVVSIHRYPFPAVRATLAAAASDAAKFRTVIASVRGLMQAAGQGGKPLALMEMNVAYDATSCVLDASPGTVGSALWLVDALGAAMDVGLWTSAIWNIADAEDWSLGLIDLPPAHEPRPEYYAYKLYADHFGTTLLGAPTAPAGVTVHASRNSADDATEAVLANWNSSAVKLEFHVSGTATTPTPATFQFPAMAIGAVVIPDHGAASAWAYSDDQRLAGAGPAALTEGGGAVTVTDGGAGRPAGKTVGAGCRMADAGRTCPAVAVTSAAVTTMGTAADGMLTFGSGAQIWRSYTYAAPGQTAPSGTVTADGGGFQISGGFVAPVTTSTNYAGFGFYFSSASCLDASTYHGIQFDYTGDLGGCLLALGATFTDDLSPTDDPVRGTCAGSAGTCYAPAADVTAAATAAAPTIKVPFSSIMNGSPISTFDPTTIVGLQWQLSTTPGAPDGGGACAAAFTISNVSFY